MGIDLENSDFELNEYDHLPIDVADLFDVVKEKVKDDQKDRYHLMTEEQQSDLDSWYLLIVDLYYEMISHLPSRMLEEVTSDRWKIGHGKSPMEDYNIAHIPKLTVGLVHQRMLEIVQAHAPQQEFDVTLKYVDPTEEEFKELIEIYNRDRLFKENRSWCDVIPYVNQLQEEYTKYIMEDLLQEVTIELLDDPDGDNEEIDENFILPSPINFNYYDDHRNNISSSDGSPY